MEQAEQIKAKMNFYGSRKEPFIFGLDYELNRGFFKLNPFSQKEIIWKIGNRGNSDFLTPLSKGSFFKAFPLSFDAYERKFSLVQKELRKGNSFLLNLTTKTPIQTNFSLSDIFQKSNANYNLLFPDKFVCFSPETFVKIKGNKISSYPMKGTIDGAIDSAEQKILTDYKEQAEHFTIVDFIRNDISRVATDVIVKRLRYIDRLKTCKGEILQVSSEIEGSLASNWHVTLGDLFFELLPAGSISGAPKMASLNIIRRAEQEKRGYYSGVFGLYDGENVDTAVLIRYIEKEEDAFFFRSGGGITINSELENEYEEVIEKVYLPFNF